MFLTFNILFDSVDVIVKMTICYCTALQFKDSSPLQMRLRVSGQCHAYKLRIWDDKNKEQEFQLAIVKFTDIKKEVKCGQTVCHQ